VLCLQETEVQDQDFPAETFREAGYHATFRGMKGYNGVATLSRQKPERVLHGLHEGPDYGLGDVGTCMQILGEAGHIDPASTICALNFGHIPDGLNATERYLREHGVSPGA
jgi:exonuclease III